MPRKRHLRAIGAADATPTSSIELPTNRVPSVEELEAMLDEQGDEEFGETELQVASAEKRAVLKEWSAADFANIYTRYRPHLERHARKWIQPNPG